METKVGKFILTHWVNGDYQSRALRRITKENKKYLVCDVQRYVWDWNKEPYDYRFHYNWAKKFVKDNSELGFRRSVGRRDNTEGIMKLELIDDPSIIRSETPFPEHDELDLYVSFSSTSPEIETMHPMTKSISTWDINVIDYLKQFLF